MISCFLVFVSVVVLWALGAHGLMRAGRVRPEPTEHFDAIVVLGCHVRADGTPGPAFQRRIETACDVFRAGAADKLLITGGRVGGPITEAEAARVYIATRALAAPDRVVLEDRATSTRANATLTRGLLGDARVLVVTTDWHVPRARRVFARSFSHVMCVGAPGRLRGALREVIAWLVDGAR